ncbi:MAG TPA: ABC transporter permease [Candidatus Deferrimicrobium sp.]|nr:ABC transporter permease [Candidatus Kapabacteria bacterium]HLP60737.1 ABC transporter permease [Candidatus Deferrimicrobium sp.]
MEIKKRNHQLHIGAVLLGMILLLMLFLAVSRGVSTGMNIRERLQPPGMKHLLGTDDLGRDLLSCILYGVGVSLIISLTVVLLSVFLGIFVGMVSGLAGGLMDAVIMRIVDIILAFPGILLAIGLVSFFRQGIVTLIMVLTFCGWVSYARIARGEVLKYKQKEFILAARSYNASFARIIFHHLLPLLMPVVVVQATLGIAGVILAESSLNFLGIGLDPRIPTLGQLIDVGRNHIFDRPGLIVIPGGVLFLIIMAFNFIGEGLRKKFTR